MPYSNPDYIWDAALGIAFQNFESACPTCLKLTFLLFPQTLSSI